MLRIALILFAIAIVAGLLAYAGVTSASTQLAEYLFPVFVASFIFSLVFTVIEYCCRSSNSQR